MNTPDTNPPPFDAPSFLATLTQRPGVYRMLDGQGEVIYVGKAKNLKRRLASHFGQGDASSKQRAMITRVRDVQVTVTHTEREALLLENQLIKAHKPRYNINLRDDKSYPYITVSTHQEFPRVSFHRGARPKQGRHFGPFASAGAVRESLKLLQKIFRVRQCRDSFFRNRSRPCLQHQIQRCTAPCVGLIDAAGYAEDVADTVLFLEGKGERLIGQLIERMQKASERQHFELAARYRDQIASLRTVLATQAVAGETGDLDIIAAACHGAMACVQVVFIRTGQLVGDRTFFLQAPDDTDAADLIEAFIPQYYLDRPVPRELIVSHELRNETLLAEFLTIQAQHPVGISARVRGERLKRLQLAVTNAESLLKSRLSSRMDQRDRFDDLGRALGLAQTPNRLECFDISHLQGDQTVASCVVFDRDGPLKSAYRRFNIEGVQPGDDYAALAQAVDRRYQRIRRGEVEAPDILFIDGGKGQVRAVQDALDALGMAEITVLGVAKGPDRRAGMEVLFRPDHGSGIELPTSSPARLLIQHIRDEAHRFAITGHRQRRRSGATTSILDSIEGLGPKRRQTLLHHFGGLREIGRAGVDALCSVQGINRQLAQRIYETLNERDS
ncbi:excinuclease ABC subunit UvrC [Methylolobus aquaticus]|nr:excinuclease ABC subunit UvrC [Methylolobus aquaticus]